MFHPLRNQGLLRTRFLTPTHSDAAGAFPDVQKLVPRLVLKSVPGFAPGFAIKFRNQVSQPRFATQFAANL